MKTEWKPRRRKPRKWTPTPDGMTLPELIARFPDPPTARAYLESLLWPNGPVCPKCGEKVRVYKITPRSPDSTTRPGLHKCGACKRQFTVTVGTIFEDTHLPLHLWLIAFYLLSSSKKGFSACQLERALGVTHKTAWFVFHRIRHAMKHPAFAGGKLGGAGKVIEADETWIGGKAVGAGSGNRAAKVSIVALVERGGRSRTITAKDLTKDTIGVALAQHADMASHLMTDESAAYPETGTYFASHRSVNHGENEYARREGDMVVTTNPVEGFFANLKRGINGVYHHVSERYLPNYLGEFDFRYSERKASDEARMVAMIQAARGRRMPFRPTVDERGKQVWAPADARATA